MFEAIHSDDSHTIHLPAPPARTFLFFTPEGERNWVDGWEPHYFHRPEGESLEGTVFSTTHGGEQTLWCVASHDPTGHRVRYSRLSPGSRAALVDVDCRVQGEETAVTVRFRSTGLSEAGNAIVGSMSGPAYRTMIEDWRTLILPLL